MTGKTGSSCTAEKFSYNRSKEKFLHWQGWCLAFQRLYVVSILQTLWKLLESLNCWQFNQIWLMYFWQCQESLKIIVCSLHWILQQIYAVIFFPRKCCVWGANHSQPGDWWDALLEQELGQGGFLCNITSSQPWSHHSRLSEHTAVQVHITAPPSGFVADLSIILCLAGTRYNMFLVNVSHDIMSYYYY